MLGYTINICIFYSLCFSRQCYLLKGLVAYNQAIFQHPTRFSWRDIAFWIWCLPWNSHWNKWPKTFFGGNFRTIWWASQKDFSLAAPVDVISIAKYVSVCASMSSEKNQILGLHLLHCRLPDRIIILYKQVLFLHQVGLNWILHCLEYS